jgi:purine-cytosine permease-like protein
MWGFVQASPDYLFLQLVVLPAVLGSRYGVSTMFSSRAVLWSRGSYGPTVLDVAQLVGWASFEILMMGDSDRLTTGQFLGSYTVYFWIFLAVFCMVLSTAKSLGRCERLV